MNLKDSCLNSERQVTGVGTRAGIGAGTGAGTVP